MMRLDFCQNNKKLHFWHFGAIFGTFWSIILTQWDFFLVVRLWHFPYFMNLELHAKTRKINNSTKDHSHMTPALK